MARRRTVYYVETPDKGGLFLREAPFFSANVLRMIPYGEKVVLDSDLNKDGWVSVKGGGYVRMEFLN